MLLIAIVINNLCILLFYCLKAEHCLKPMSIQNHFSPRDNKHYLIFPLMLNKETLPVKVSSIPRYTGHLTHPTPNRPIQPHHPSYIYISYTKIHHPSNPPYHQPASINTPPVWPTLPPASPYNHPIRPAHPTTTEPL